MKEGGLLSLPELQMVVPPRCALQDHAASSAPLLLMGLRHHPGKASLEHGSLDKGKLAEGAMLPLDAQPGLEVVYITHPSASNAAILSASVEQCACVLIHSRGRGWEA